MSSLEILPVQRLQGEVSISGAKNSILPQIAACLLTEDPVTLVDLPNIMDIERQLEIVKRLGAKIVRTGRDVCIQCPQDMSTLADDVLCSQLRASFLITGPLLTRFGRARLTLPGGCEIGMRPVDLHLKAFEDLGAKIIISHGFLEMACERLTGSIVYLDFPSVGCTENAIMAAVLAKGKTIIVNAAKEPEIQDLVNMLRSMGARITGAGSAILTITGVRKLSGTVWKAIGDRIEAGTFLIAAAAVGGKVTVRNIESEYLWPVTAKLREAGACVTEDKDVITLEGSSRMNAVSIKTLPWPGYPTDLQPQLMALDTTAQGISIISECLFENRYRHVDGLTRMGANIRINQKNAIIEGVENLSGSNVTATDLRAGAALAIAGLKAQGPTLIGNAELIQRGYERFVEKFGALGAKMSFKE